MNSGAFRYGMFGVGRCGCVHAETLLAQGQELAALGDESPDALNAAVRRLGVARAARFTDPAAMAGSGLIDAAVISSHTCNHARDATPFIEAGIPVYLEKPLTSELSEAFAFVKALGPRKNLLQIGLQRRFDEALCYAKTLLEANRIGEIREIRSILRDQYPPPATYSSRGLIIDMGIHVADEALWLTGEFPNKVWAKMFHAKGYRSPIDEGGNTAHVGFLTPGGTIGRLDLSRTHASGYNNETYLIGTEGTLHVGRFCGYPGPIHVELWRKNGTMDADSRTFPMTEFQREYAEFQPRFQRAYSNAHTHFREAVRAKQNFVVGPTEVLHAQVMVEAAHRSALNGGAEFTLAYSPEVEDFERLCRIHQLL